MTIQLNRHPASGHDSLQDMSDFSGSKLGLLMQPSQVCHDQDQNLPERIQVKADYLQIHVSRGLAFRYLFIIEIKINDLLSTLIYID